MPTLLTPAHFSPLHTFTPAPQASATQEELDDVRAALETTQLRLQQVRPRA